MWKRKHVEANFYGYLGGYIIRWLKKNNIGYAIGIKPEASGKYQKKTKV